MARTRSRQAHEKVLRAALELFGARGIDATSMDAIAQSSGVSKATIYSHWTDKGALLLEVMDLVHGLDREPEDIDSGDLCRDLITVLTRRPPDEFERARARLTPSLIAYSAVHQEFGQAWRNRVMQPARQCIQQILRRGIRQGQLRAVDTEVAIALLLGPMLYSHIFQKGRGPQSPDIGPQVAEAFWRAYRTDKAQKEASPKR
jgi:AcrR family transcriptional regulator